MLTRNMTPSLTLLIAIVVVGCGKGPNGGGSRVNAESEAALTILPEFAPALGVLLSSLSPAATAPQSQGTRGESDFGRDLLLTMDSIARNATAAKHISLGDSNGHPASNVSYIGGGGNVWAQDWVPLMGLNAEQKPVAAILGFKSPSEVKRQHSLKVISALGIEDVRTTSFRMDGGNFMVDDDGVCVTTTQTVEKNEGAISTEDLVKAMELELGCRKVIVTTPLPGESTGHVDLFAKFVGGNRVLLNRYARDTLVLSDVVKTTVQVCADSAAEDCEEDVARSSDSWAHPGKPLRDDDGKVREFSMDEVLSLVREKHRVDVPAAAVPTLRATTAFLDAMNTWKSDLSGFDVTWIDTPPPFVVLNVIVYVDGAGNELKRDIAFERVDVTFSNALIVNETAFVPQFPLLAEPQQNQAALDLFKSLPTTSKAVGIETESLSSFGGNIHCVTRTIPDMARGVQ